MNRTKDYLSYIPGQLRQNYNYLYMANGGLEERGGGALLKAPPAAGAVYSLANYEGASGNSYLITNQSTKVYYFTTAWNDTGVAVTTSLKTRWAQAGVGALKAFYGVNGTDSVTKIVEVAGTPTGTAVASSPTAMIDIIQHKNRLFGIAEDGTLSWTEALAYETWNTGVNNTVVGKSADGKGQKLEIWGDALFIIKEYGVYVLPNADDIAPKLNWVFLRTDAATGTQSPDSVQVTRTGIMYLGSDLNVRQISSNTTFSSGEYTLGKTGSPVISAALEDDLIPNLDRSRISHATSIVHNDLYILSWQSNDAATNYNDRTFFADTTKWMEWVGFSPQPYWGEFTGFDYQFYAKQTVTGRVKLYGVKGVSTIGQTHETLNETICNDNGEGIDAYIILGWWAIGGESAYKNIKQVYMVADTENWNIDCKFQAYKYRQSLPSDGEGIVRIYSTSSIAGVGVVGTAIVGSSIVGNIGVSSNRFQFGLKGYYFKAEFRNQNANEFTRINKIIVYYRTIKNK